jgi:5-methylcytosine-specific restriction endonuclease McrA
VAREPWIKLLIGFRRNPKIAGLPDDGARLGWVYAMLEAKVQREMGVFGSEFHFTEVLGRHGRYVKDYLAAGLLETDPDLCEECAIRYGELRHGVVVVHDFLREQRSATSSTTEDAVSSGAKRTALWRLRQAVFTRDQHTCRYCGRADYERDWLIAEHVIPNGPTTLENLVTACRSCNKKKGGRTPEEAGMTPLPVPVGDGVTRHSDASPVRRDAVTRRVSSRARPTTATATRTERESSPHGRGSKNRDSPAVPERADVQALLDHGYRRVTAKQRTVLDEIADRHRRKGDDGSWFAVSAIANAGDLDPLRAVIGADRDAQEANKRRIAEEESIWSQTKARDRREAEAILAGSRSRS